MKTGVLGIFSNEERLLKAIDELRQMQIAIKTVYSPFYSEEIQQSMGVKLSPVRFATLIGGITGLCIGVGFAVYTFAEWGFIASGKPTTPFVPLVVVGFEMTILFGFLATLFAMWILGRLFRRLAPYYEPSFSKDVFGVLVIPDRFKEEELVLLLKDHGAVEVKKVVF